MTRLLVWLRQFGIYRGAVDLYARSALFRGLVIAVIPVAWILVLTLAPYAQMALISFYERYPLPPGEAVEFTARHYGSFAERPLYLTAFIRSFVFATLVTALTLIVVFPVAYFISKVAPRGQRTRLLLLVIAPFWISEVIRSFAWMIMLSNSGAINSLIAYLGLRAEPFEMLYTNLSLSIGVLYLTSLYMLLPVYSALEKIDSQLLDAAANLGAPAWKRFTRIILPLARDGIVSGCTLVFLLVIGLYAMPQLLGGPRNTLFAATIGQIFSKAGDSWPQGSAFSLILIGAALGYVGLFTVLFQSRRRRRAT